MSLQDMSAADLAAVMNNDGNGFGNGNGWWIILLFLFLGWGNRGYGNNGGGAGDVGGDMIYPWMNQAQAIWTGFSGGERAHQERASHEGRAVTLEPFYVNNVLWRVVRVAPGDPRLVDRLSHECLGTTDPLSNTVYLSDKLVSPMLDKVLLHEVAHAITMSYGLLDFLHAFVPEESWVAVEEWAANLVEEHSIEVSVLASESIGRPICVNGHCAGRPLDVCFASCAT